MGSGVDRMGTDNISSMVQELRNLLPTTMAALATDIWREKQEKKMKQRGKMVKKKR